MSSDQLVQDLLTIYEALGPIFLMIGLGYGLRRSQFPGEAFWPAAERLTYFLLFPALLVHKLALAELGSYDLAPIGAVIIATLTIISAALFLLRPLLPVRWPGFSSIYQGGIRFNTYVGLAAASALFQTAGLTVAALAMAVLIPMVNVLCVAVLTAASGTFSILNLARSLVVNPLILACSLGISLNASDIGLPLGSAAVLDILARAALPLGLLAVGAGLRLHAAFSRHLEIACAVLVKLLVMPALTYVLCLSVGLQILETAVLVLFAALPGAPSSYILARQMGGDAELMAAIITVETALSMLSLPIVVVLIS